MELTNLFKVIEERINQQLQELGAIDYTPALDEYRTQNKIEPPIRKLSARFNIDEFNTFGAGLQKEILAAIAQEAGAEIIVDMFNEIVNSDLEIVSHYDVADSAEYMFAINDQHTKPENAIKQGFDKVKDKINWMIVNPTVGAIIQSANWDISGDKQPPYISPLAFMGICDGVKIYINPWAPDNTPIILGTDGAIEIHSKGISMGESAVCPMTFELNTFIRTHYKFSINEDKLKKITIDARTMMCFI